MGKPRITILIPAYNEESSIKEVLINLKSFNVLVMDDHSSDKTVEIASQFSNCEVISNSHNLGYERNLLRGLLTISNRLAGKENYIITIDGDGELPSSAIPAFLERTQDSSFIIGCRSNYNRLIEFFGGKYSKYNYGISDPFCGMRLFGNRFLSDFLNSNVQYNLGLGPISFAFKNNFLISEIQIKSEKRNGAPRFARGMEANRLLTKAIISDYKQ